MLNRSREIFVPYNLARSQTIQTIVTDLESAPPSCQDGVAEYQRLKAGGFGGGEKGDEQIAGLLFELHLQSLIFKMAQSSPLLSIAYLTHPVRSRNFLLLPSDRHPYSVTARKHHHREPYAEYDFLVMAGELPIIVEATIAQTYSQIQNHVQEKSIRHKLEPLADFFGTTQFGFILATVINAAQPRELSRFLEAGGYHASLQHTHATWVRESKKITRLGT